MAINIFKKEKDKKSAPAPKKEAKAAPVKAKTAANPGRKISDSAARLLKYPHVTEKASSLAKNNQYVFKVAKAANKIEIARAVENSYRVNVASVRTINIGPKRKRRGKGIAVIPGYRKAIVKIKEGQTIEVMPK